MGHTRDSDGLSISDMDQWHSGTGTVPGAVPQPCLGNEGSWSPL